MCIYVCLCVFVCVSFYLRVSKSVCVKVLKEEPKFVIFAVKI